MTDTRDLFQKLRFYAIYNPPSALSPTRWLDAVLDAGFTTVQVRDKNNLIDRKILRVMAHRCHRAEAFFIMNDRVDIACEVEADGVHIGDQDRAVTEIRSVFKNWVIGRSARTVDTAVTAWKDGADYVGTGPVFATNSKAGLPDPIGWSGFNLVADATPLPTVAIGGMTVDRLKGDDFRRATGLAFMSELSSLDRIANAGRWIRDQL